MNALRTFKVFAAIGLCAAGVTAFPSDAAACGGPFGPGFTIADQKILVSHRSGTQSYVFQPNFCGEAKSFGLVLPIPAALSKNPALAPSSLFSDLATLAAPTVVKKTECANDQGNGPKSGGAGGSFGTDAGSVNVVGVGQVGIFDWSLLQATTATAFTDWLDVNGYPHEAKSDALFAHYVTKGWYFVAFKISASDDAPPTGMRVCGDLGPINLAFPSSAPTLPARMAASGAIGDVRWDLYTAAAGGELSPPASTVARMRFAGDPAASELAKASFGGLLAPGDHVARYEMVFDPNALTDDIALSMVAKSTMRETVYEITTVECDPSGKPTETPGTSTATPGNSAAGTGTGTGTGTGPGSSSNSSGGCAVHASSTSQGSGFLAGLVGLLGVALARHLARRRKQG